MPVLYLINHVLYINVLSRFLALVTDDGLGIEPKHVAL
jgi:hypothetical protein